MVQTEQQAVLTSEMIQTEKQSNKKGNPYEPNLQTASTEHLALYSKQLHIHAPGLNVLTGVIFHPNLRQKYNITTLKDTL